MTRVLCVCVVYVYECVRGACDVDSGCICVYVGVSVCDMWYVCMWRGVCGMYVACMCEMGVCVWYVMFGLCVCVISVWCQC